MILQKLRYFLKPDWEDSECLDFYQRHTKLWTIRVGNIKCLFGFHKWISAGRLGAYCDRCPMDKDENGNMEFCTGGRF